MAAQRQIAFYGKGDSATAVAVRPSKQLKKDLTPIFGSLPAWQENRPRPAIDGLNEGMKC
ncbi:hypothetical protein VPK21_000823 (plasmid) [Sinorhizobium kummerowiae]|uniref:Uncharacterized protein n=1 Tax=Sinorhizobium kummerowiae TaxID=158892 RepID=A0ABY8TGM8_9HYPH|nr:MULTISPECIES: hypothetical protein [Sinorhizobium]WHS95903.1 hypothetical protein PZL22_006097 [Sinorhizobium kummerowiae]WQH42119.1 hypothetical protein VPK21_000823 [Sinorhizobium kummerowiae]